MSEGNGHTRPITFREEMASGLRDLWRDITCRHHFVAKGKVGYYCHALSVFAAPGSLLDRRRLAVQGYRCTKCNRWKVKKWFEE